MPLKVFIAEDSTLVCQRLIDMLSELEGPEAVELIGRAEDAQEAVEAIQRLNPDVAILDICLAEGSGIQVLEAIKSNGTSPVVIMLTAFPYPQYRTKCLEAGADYFFDKLTEFDQVAGVVAELCKTRITEQE
ncbi:MAG: response regulator transcription factor [Anaerolineae bacterium]|jgi:two-component system response regulator DevR